MGRKTLSKEWELVTWTTHEEVTFVSKPLTITDTPSSLLPTSQDHLVTSLTDTVDELTGSCDVVNRTDSVEGGTRQSQKVPVLGHQSDTAAVVSCSSSQQPAAMSLTLDVTGTDTDATVRASQLDQLINSLMEIAIQVEAEDLSLNAL
jgi:hypothetical protein